MWRLTDSAVQRFPLIPRPRPACLPLPERVHALAELAGSAVRTSDPSLASTVYNQAALISSDVGAPDTARTMCHQHAVAYLQGAPLTAAFAVRALEPVVNLARLHLRAQQYEAGGQLLTTLFEAVTTGSPVQIADIAIPADLVTNTADRREVSAWLWRVLLADGTRALTTAGRWAEALAHVEGHNGVGKRMLDGRQVAVLAALMSGNNLAASTLLARTQPGETWESTVTDCLTVMCRRTGGRPWRRALQSLVSDYIERPAQHGLAVFDTRLGLAVLDVISSGRDPAARMVVADVHRRTMKATDGYAAREALKHPLFTGLGTDQEVRDCRALLDSCSLEKGSIPNELAEMLAIALQASDRVIRQNTAHRTLTRANRRE